MNTITNLSAFLCIFILCSCFKSESEFVENQTIQNIEYKINTEGKNIIDRFPAPEGFKTEINTEDSFANYLQKLPLKKFGEKVKYFNGQEKPADNVYISVIDQPITPRDVQQCADAIMRLKGEFHYSKKEYDQIHFNFLSDGKPRYFTNYANGDYSYTKFMKYMNYIMAFANTASLKDELELVNIADVKIGDVLIQKGNPYGHAVIVVNLASDKSGNKKIMLAQSYMPAQETQILLNPNKLEPNPWYDVKPGKISTPEWSFNSSDLHRFPQ